MGNHGGKQTDKSCPKFRKLGWNRPKSTLDPKKVYSFLWVFFMSSLENIQAEIDAIKGRNARVEQEKSWETSWQRKLGIIVTTYFVMILVFWSLGNSEPFLNAIVPTLGYTLSTLSLDWIRKIFLQYK